jgi:hypothetical protein
MDMTVKIWKSSVIAGHLSRNTQNDGTDDEDDERLEGNAFAEKGEKGLSGMLDDEQRDLDDGYEEEEGGGMAIDDAKRRKMGEKIEVRTFGGSN